MIRVTSEKVHDRATVGDLKRLVDKFEADFRANDVGKTLLRREVDALKHDFSRLTRRVSDVEKVTNVDNVLSSLNDDLKNRLSTSAAAAATAVGSNQSSILNENLIKKFESLNSTLESFRRELVDIRSNDIRSNDNSTEKQLVDDHRHFQERVTIQLSQLINQGH